MAIKCNSLSKILLEGFRRHHFLKYTTGLSWMFVYLEVLNVVST